MRLIIFDFDGTIMNSFAAIHHCMEHAFRTIGRPIPSKDEIRKRIGMTLDVLMADMDPGCDPKAATEAYRDAFLDLRARDALDEHPYPDALETIKALNAAPNLLGVATGKSLAGLSRSLETLGIADQFISLQTPDHNASKPAPDMILKLLDQTGVDPGQTVMIGDSPLDIGMAKNAGVASIGVCWGYNFDHELQAAGADLVANSWLELPAKIDQLCPLKAS